MRSPCNHFIRPVVVVKWPYGSLSGYRQNSCLSKEDRQFFHSVCRKRIPPLDGGNSAHQWKALSAQEETPQKKFTSMKEVKKQPVLLQQAIISLPVHSFSGWAEQYMASFGWAREEAPPLLYSLCGKGYFQPESERAACQIDLDPFGLLSYDLSLDAFFGFNNSQGNRTEDWKYRNTKLPQLNIMVWLR